jgi:hypothetical protein
MSKQAMPLSLVLIRQSIETQLAGIKELLPDSYKITFVAVTDKPDQEIILTESKLSDIGQLLIEHGKERHEQ